MDIATISFYIGWFAVFLFCYLISTYQFRYCIPVAVEVMKVLNAVGLLLFIRLYYLFRVEQFRFEWVEVTEAFHQAWNWTAMEL